MDYSDFNISREQAQQIAFTIIADIEEYIEKHYKEYEMFLKAEGKQEGGDNNVVA